MSAERSGKWTEREADELFESTWFKPDNFRYFYPLLVSNAGFSYETILREYFKGDHPRSLLPVSLMDPLKIKAHNNLFLKVGGLSAYYIHDLFHGIYSFSDNQKSPHYESMRLLFKSVFQSLNIAKTKKRNSEIEPSEIGSVIHQRKVVAGLYVIFHEFLRTLSPISSLIDCPDFPSAKITVLKLIKEKIMDEKNVLEYIHPYLYQAAAKRISNLLSEKGVSTITIQVPIEDIKYDEKSAPSYTWNQIIKHPRKGIYQIKTVGDRITECNWISGNKSPSVPRLLVGEYIDYDAAISSIWDGQYADIAGYSEWAETGEFTGGEPCPHPDKIIQRSIEISRLIQKLCVDAIDYAIDHYEREVALSAPALAPELSVAAMEPSEPVLRKRKRGAH